jgi:uncharacterized protein YuzE
MAKENPKDIPKGLMYDEEEDILFFTKGKPSKGTLEIGDFIIDLDKDGNLTALEILNASSVLGLKPKLLSSIKYAKLGIESTPNSLYLSLIMFGDTTERIKVPIPLAAPIARREPILSSSWTTYRPIPA